MVEIINIQKTYKSKNGKHTKALENISLKFDQNGLVFITGKSGCGKSTLLNILGTLDSYNQGEIKIDGRSLSKFSNKEINDYRNYDVGFVFQEYNLLEDYTVYKNLEIAIDLQNADDKEKRIQDALHEVGLCGLENRMIYELSGGQCQRVAIARAIVKKPRIVLCDEPTGALDSENGKIVFELLKKMSQTSLVIVVSHDREFAYQYGDRIIELIDGKVSKDELIQNKNQPIKINKRISHNHKFLVKNKMLLSFSYLKKRPVRLSIAILLSIICFVLVGVSSSISSMNRNELIVHSMYENDVRYCSFTKSAFLEETSLPINLCDDDIQYMSKQLNTNEMDIVYDYFIQTIPYVQTELARINSNYYYPSNNGFAELTETFIKRYKYTLYGTIPLQDNEIVIPKYFFDIYKTYGYQKENMNVKIDNYTDIINQTLDFFDSKLGSQSFKIVGILDTNFNEKRYAPLLEENINTYKYKTLVDEIREMMKSGLHNIIYLNQGYYERTAKNLYRDQFSSTFNFKILHVNTEVNEYDDLILNHFSTIKIINDEATDIYKNKQNLENNGVGIILPLSLTGVNEYLNADVIKGKVDDAITDFAQMHYEEIKEQFEIDGGYGGFTTWVGYYYYIDDLGKRGNNKYHPGINYSYFENIYIQEELENKEIFADFTHIMVQGWYTYLNYNVELIGFYNDEYIGTNDTIFVEYPLYQNILADLGPQLYDYKYVTTPITRNYDTDLKKIQFRDKNRNEQINIVDYYHENESSKYTKYNIDNEITYTINNIEGIMEIVLLIFKYICFALMVFIILFINYYFCGLILDKKKEIGILRAMGATNKDVVEIFFFEGFLILCIITFLSSILTAVTIKIGNHYMITKYYFLLSLLNFRLTQILLITMICIVSILLGIAIPLFNLIKKEPINLIKFA